MRTYLLSALLLLPTACTSTGALSKTDHVRLVSTSGTAISGATLRPEEEVIAGLPFYFNDRELAAMTTNSKGDASVELSRYLWADGRYHFHITKGGFEDQSIVIPKDQFASVLKIDLSPKK